MKRIVFALFTVGLIACQSTDQKKMTQAEKEQATRDSTNFTSITWIDSTARNLGKIKEGQVPEITYRFKNTGTKNLIIAEVSATCGCTIPERPDKPIPPGGEETIRAKFDSRGRIGTSTKHITVKSNTMPQESTLVFTVEVIE